MLNLFQSLHLSVLKHWFYLNINNSLYKIEATLKWSQTAFNSRSGAMETNKNYRVHSPFHPPQMLLVARSRCAGWDISSATSWLVLGADVLPAWLLGLMHSSC